MKQTFIYAAGMMLSCALFFMPHHASALGLSFGGRIITTYYACLNAAVYITIKPAGGDPNIAYIWTPATVTYSVGTFNTGGQVLGVADVPYTCVVSVTPPVTWPGQRMQIVGSSLE